MKHRDPPSPHSAAAPPVLTWFTPQALLPPLAPAAAPPPSSLDNLRILRGVIEAAEGLGGGQALGLRGQRGGSGKEARFGSSFLGQGPVGARLEVGTL